MLPQDPPTSVAGVEGLVARFRAKGARGRERMRQNASGELRRHRRTPKNKLWAWIYPSNPELPEAERAGWKQGWGWGNPSWFLMAGQVPLGKGKNFKLWAGEHKIRCIWRKEWGMRMRVVASEFPFLDWIVGSPIESSGPSLLPCEALATTAFRCYKSVLFGTMLASSLPTFIRRTLFPIVHRSQWQVVPQLLAPASAPMLPRYVCPRRSRRRPTNMSLAEQTCWYSHGRVQRVWWYPLRLRYRCDQRYQGDECLAQRVR